MNQKLSDWASIAEIISGIAVVVTLIVLIVEVRDNTEILRVSAYNDNLDSLNEFGALVSRDADSARIWQSLVSEETDNLDEIDRRRLTDWLFILFRNYEKAYFSEQSGLIGEEEWARFSRNICNFFELSQSASIDFTVPLTQEFSSYVVGSCGG
jgi:hypothetical protein